MWNLINSYESFSVVHEAKQVKLPWFKFWICHISYILCGPEGTQRETSAGQAGVFQATSKIWALIPGNVLALIQIQSHTKYYAHTVLDRYTGQL